MTQVLENSDNVAMVWVTDKLGSDRYFEYLKNFGFDDQTGIDLQGEADPQILPRSQWRPINRATMSFGQGIAVTPLQLTAAYAALANGGKLLWPHLVTAFTSPDGKVQTVEPKVVRQVVSEETSRKITTMLVSVVENGHGKRARISGYKIAGKTGTAQVPSASGGYEEERHVGSFCGYAPADNPLFAMCVKLDTPRNVDWAEASAAPVFGEIMGWLLAHYGVRPSE
jgi:cell division protein FtsI/penicillin-binding protein 2